MGGSHRRPSDATEPYAERLTLDNLGLYTLATVKQMKNKRWVVRSFQLIRNLKEPTGAFLFKYVDTPRRCKVGKHSPSAPNNSWGISLQPGRGQSAQTQEQPVVLNVSIFI